MAPEETEPSPMAAGRLSRVQATLLTILLLGCVAALLAPLPDADLVATLLLDMVHAPLFAGVAWLLCRLAGRRPGLARCLTVWVVLAGCGYLIEMAQGATGRHASLRDAFSNTMGALAGVLWAAAGGSRWGLRLLAAPFCLGLLALGWFLPLLMLADMAIQRSQAPLLASFEQPLENSRWEVRDAAAARVTSFHTEGRWGLQVTLHPAEYPAIIMRRPLADWQSYHTLAFDLRVEKPVALILKITDAPHNFAHEDRFHLPLKLSRGTHRIRVPLAAIRRAPAGREMDMRQIAALEWFAVNPATEQIVWLDHLRLE